jgi:heptosyltransferase-2/heptosyltransferase-3
VIAAGRAARLAGLRLVGPALVALGRLARRRAGPASGAGTRPGSGPRIVLIRPDHLGDVLLASPAATVVQDALPDARIDWLVGPWSADVARRCGGPARVLTIDFPGFTRRPKRSPIEPYLVLVRAAARLRAGRYDAALVLRPDHWWGAMLAGMAGIPRRFGFAVAECRPFLTDALPVPRGHVVRSNQVLARLAGLRLGGRLADEAAIVDPRFPVSAHDASWAERWERSARARAVSSTGPSHAATASVAGRSRHDAPGPDEPAAPPASHAGDRADWPLIALHPGSGARIKNWPPERWVAVIGALREVDGARVVLTGGPGEGELVESIAARLDPRPETLVGETTRGQLAALFARCDLVLGGDSGPLHLAAAVGTPTVRLYGPTDVGEFGPWPPTGPHAALAASLPCQPCRTFVGPPCGATESPPCLRAIGVDQVVRGARQLLGLSVLHREHSEHPLPAEAGPRC